MVNRQVGELLSLVGRDNSTDVADLVGEVEYHQLRYHVINRGERVESSKPTDARAITIQELILPRAHGSALFTLGQTHALVAAMLGTEQDVQRLDSLDNPDESTNSIMLHYNFPSFSTGKVRPMRGTSRREIGHGNLAE